MPLPDWTRLFLFMLLLLVLCAFVVVAAGHFPAQTRHGKFRTHSGAAILWGSITAAVLSAAWALYFAAQALPWYAAVIGGGLTVLTAPLLVQPLPNKIVDSRIALLLLGAASLALDYATFRLH